MNLIIKSELLKQKSRFYKRIVYIAPIITILISLLLMGGEHIQISAYNWWYTIILPGTITIISSFIIASEKKRRFHGLFSILVDIKKLWYGKILVSTMYLALTCLIFFLSITILGALFSKEISIFNSLSASILLFVLFLWQIPLWMYVSMKLNSSYLVIVSLFCNIISSVIFSIRSIWWIPFAIPARVMINVLGLLPNGLNVEKGSKLIDEKVTLLGMLISIILYLSLSYFTAKWFDRQEV